MRVPDWLPQVARLGEWDSGWDRFRYLEDGEGKRLDFIPFRWIHDGMKAFDFYQLHRSGTIVHAGLWSIQSSLCGRDRR